MSRLQRRRRIRCRIPCEIVEGRRRQARAAVTTLSEGGLGLEAALTVDQGDSIRLRILPKRGARAVEVEAIVWNSAPSRRGSSAKGVRVLGCVVSDPPDAYLALFAEVDKRNTLPDPRLRPVSRRPPAAPAAARVPEADLPRSRAPMPPPKPEPEETLPNFRVRLKQVGGPRTRVISVRAHSCADAEAQARAELARAGAGDCEWEVLGAGS